MRKIEIDVEENGVCEVGCYPTHDAYGIYAFLKGFGYEHGISRCIASWAQVARPGDVFEFGKLYAVVEDE